MTTNIFIIKWYHVFSQPFFLIRKGIENCIKPVSKQISGTTLDFGCGSKPYLQYFYHVDKYIGMDIEVWGHLHENEKIDVFYDGKTIPFDDEYFDFVFSSEVFEHVFNLDEILLELNWILKPAGKILFTCPFAWPEHEVPFDYARYSSYGIKALIEKNGFKVIEQYKTGHFFEVIMQYLIFLIYCFLPKKSKVLYLILHQLFLLPLILFTFIISFLLPKKMKRKDLYFNNILLVEKVQK